MQLRKAKVSADLKTQHLQAAWGEEGVNRAGLPVQTQLKAGRGVGETCTYDSDCDFGLKCSDATGECY